MAENKRKDKSRDLLDRVDCQVIVYREKIPQKGEDACVYSMNAEGVLIGVFDGCGGSGAKRYARMQGMSGAYIASRVVSGTVRDWFLDCRLDSENDPAETVKELIRRNLQVCNRVCGETSSLISPMVKSFPTTAAFSFIHEEEHVVWVDCFWAGDSRLYLLNSDGLAQLSADDLPDQDAMENLYEDGVMTNVISLSKDFVIHHKKLPLNKPGIVFAATDGCFGYLSSPMEFEYMLLQKLLESVCASEWEQKLSDAIGAVAGDDYSLAAVVLDYGSFEMIQTALAARENELYSAFISCMKECGREEKTALWDRYKQNYYRLQEPDGK